MLMAFINKLKNQRTNQAGLASVVVVSVLVVVLSLIAIGFSRDMDRAVRQSANSSLGTAATYAARSGINDAIAYIKANPAAMATNCSDLLTDSSSDATKILANLSGDSTTKYTCMLLNPRPTDLAYQKVSSFKSQVVRINPTANLSKLMFSWQAYDQSITAFPAAGSLSLTDETAWGTNKYQPILRLSLYAVPTAVSGSVALQYLANPANSAYKTFFFYPNQAASASPSVTEINWSLGNGSLQKVNCADVHSAIFNTGTFSGSADNNCNVIINSLPSDVGHAPYYYYARITPLYTDASVIIKGNDAANSALQLINTQAIVDVTAKSGTATKRLQARVDIASNSGTDVNISASDDAFPEYALRTSNTLCKRVQVQNPGSGIRIDPASKADCSQGATIIDEQLPAQPSTGAASSITTNSARLNGTVDPKGADVLTCYFNYGTTTGYGSKQNCRPSLPRASNGPGTPVYADVGGLAQYTDYHFQLCVTNIANSWDNGVTCDGDQTFKTKALPPTVTITPGSQTITKGQQATVSWSTSPSFAPTTCNLTGHWAGYSTASSDIKTDTFNSPGTYTYTAVCTGPGGQGNTASATVTVNDPPPPSAQLGYLGVSVASNYTSNDYNYSCTNSTHASIALYPNMHNGVNGGENPVSGTSGRITLGGYYWPGDVFSARLSCYNDSGGVGTMSIPSTYFSPPVFSDFGISGQYQASPSSSAYCGDPVHRYVVCITWWSARQGSIDAFTDAYVSVKYCNIHWEANNGRVGVYNATLPKTNGNNYSLGFDSSPSGTVTITCYGDQGIPASGPPSNSVSRDIIIYAPIPGIPAPTPAPPAPSPAPGPGPAPTPPPGGGGGCGLLPGGSFYNYGFMTFPHIFFGRPPSCF